MITTKMVPLRDIVLIEDIARLQCSNDDECREMLLEAERDGIEVVWSKFPNRRACAKAQDSVYFLHCRAVNRIKIGHSINSATRVEHHRTSCPFPVEVLKCVPGGIAFERHCHMKFSHLRRHLEWFEATQELLDFINSL